MIDYYEPKLDVTLLGCGFLGGYHVGALCLLQQIWPQKPYNRICGASCGGIIGALLLAGTKLEVALDCAMEIIRQLRAFIWNPTLLRNSSIASLLEEKLEFMLPKNAHELCSNRLGLSLTKLWSLENRFVSQFESRNDLIDAIRAGCFIPGWSGTFKAPQYKGEQFVDGAYSDNCPKFRDQLENDDTDATRHIQVCAFASEADVTPSKEPYLFKARFFGNIYRVTWKNVTRSMHAMIPANVDKYLDYVVEGHRDMKEYLFRNDLLKCRDCWHKGINSETVIKEAACLACLQVLERVDSLALPKSILDIFKE